MRSSKAGVLAVLFVFTAFALSGLAEEKKASSTKAAPASKATLKAADELKWTDPPNSPPGVKWSALWGDPEKGPHGAMHKFPAGFEAPLHHHTPDYRAVVISGTLIVTPDGGAAKKLGPGSYGSFTGKMKHTTKCDTASECLIMVDAKGPWDVVLEEAKK